MSADNDHVTRAQFIAHVENVAAMSQVQNVLAQSTYDISRSAGANAKYFEAKLMHSGEVAYRLAIQFGLVMEMLGKLAVALGVDLDEELQKSEFLKTLDARASIVEQLTANVDAAKQEVLDLTNEVVSRRKGASVQMPEAKTPTPAPEPRRSHYTSSRIRTESSEQQLDRELDSLLAAAASGMTQN